MENSFQLPEKRKKKERVLTCECDSEMTNGTLAQRVGPTGRSIKDNGPTHICPGGGPVLPQFNEPTFAFCFKSRW